MGGRRIAAIALSGALVAGGTGAAIAAVTKNDDRKKVEQAVLDDAAKRLDVTPEKLRDALSAAQDAQIDQAVSDGKLTQEQADKIKAARKESGSVLGGPPGGPHLRGGPGRFGGKEFHIGPGLAGPKGGLIGDLADAVGLSADKLVQQLRSGKSIADVAKAQGKSLDSVRSSVKSAAKARLDKAVKNDDLTQKQADRMLEGLDEVLKNLDAKGGLMARRHRHLRGDMPPMPPLRPGSLLPGEAVPELEPPPGVF
jgi:flagellin-like hook-associated protein FlgL